MRQSLVICLQLADFASILELMAVQDSAAHWPNSVEEGAEMQSQVAPCDPEAERPMPNFQSWAPDFYSGLSCKFPRLVKIASAPVTENRATRVGEENPDV